MKERPYGRHRLPDRACDRRIASHFDLGGLSVSAEIIPFVPRQRGGCRRPDRAPIPFRLPGGPDDLVMDHADTVPCEYLSTCTDRDDKHR
jgi:hypothetical protein